MGNTKSMYKDGPDERHLLPLVGFSLSILYLAGVVFYLYLQGQNPADLRLNELGDLLGGVSSPLAFLWLVLGFQQSREIRLSGKALELQAKEMRRRWTSTGGWRAVGRRRAKIRSSPAR